jgi:hypothetical protein
MEWYEDDFYDEPSEFDMAIEEFKANLMKSVKDEFVTEMERLKKENKELQDVKKNFEEIKRDFENKKRELEYERNDLQRKIRRERLVDLLAEHKIILYKAYSKREIPPKCDKCDKYRKVHYVSPLGRKTSENCLCSEGKTVYFPKEFMRYEFRLNRDKNGLTAWYRQYGDDEDGLVYESSIHADSIYSPELKFEDIKQYSTFFKTKEECQSYCDYLNSKEV